MTGSDERSLFFVLKYHNSDLSRLVALMNV